MKPTLFLVLCIFFTYTYSQEVNFYKNTKGESHICGEFPLNYLEHDSTYSSWFLKNYSELKLPNKRLKLNQNLKTPQ